MRPMDDLDELAASRMPARVETDMAKRPPPAKKPIADVVTERDKQRQRAYEEEQAAQAASAGQGQEPYQAEDANAERDRRVEAEYDRREEGDELDELARERQAAEAEIDAQNARAAMNQRSRAGLGGLGLSGAASAAEGDLARTQARTKVLTMQQFDQAAEDAKFTDIQRRAALDDLEDAADLDYDNDGKVSGVKVGGKIGDGDPENDPFTGNPEDAPGAVAPTAGGKPKPVKDMTPEEFNNMSEQQALDAGWRPEKWLDDQGRQSSALFASAVLWIGPGGEEMVVPIDDAGERTSSGLEWED